MSLEDACQAIGRRVRWRSSGVFKRGATAQFGVIVNVNDRYAWVVFDGETTSKACYAGDLELAASGEART